MIKVVVSGVLHWTELRSKVCLSCCVGLLDSYSLLNMFDCISHANILNSAFVKIKYLKCQTGVNGMILSWNVGKKTLNRIIKIK